MNAAALLALASAAAFGVCDFAAGLAARRAAFLRVTVASLVASASTAWVVVAIGGWSPRWSVVLWGAMAGAGAAAGATTLYAGYGKGRMAVAGPLSAVGAAALPAVVGALLGERLSVVALVGLVAALPAIWLMASEHGGAPGPRSGVREGLVSGAGFALEFVGLERAGNAAGLWPVAVSQTTALVLVSTLLSVRRPAPDRAPRPLALAAGAGLISLAATGLYFAAATTGSLTIAAVVTSLYPGGTVLLAAVVLREGVDRRQALGLALGAAAVVMVTVG